MGSLNPYFDTSFPHFRFKKIIIYKQIMINPKKQKNGKIANFEN